MNNVHTVADAHAFPGSSSAAGIERLRISRDAAEARRTAEGNDAGKQRALEVADFEETDRIATAFAEGMGIVDTPDEAAMMLARVVLDDENLDWRDVADLMTQLFGRSAPTVAEIRGFVEGVIEIHDQV